MSVSEQKRALLTGGSGYVGHRVVSGLVEAGWKVSVLTRASTDIEVLGKAKPNLQIFQHDGRADYIVDVMREARPDVVFHLAATNNSSDSSFEIAEMLETNVTLGVQLLEAMRQVECKHLVNTGTFWSYSEDGKNKPINLYAATKLALEILIDYYCSVSELRAITLNLCDVYGPGDWRPKLLNLLKTAAKTGEPLKLTPGHQQMNLVHVDDVVDAFLSASAQVCELLANRHLKFSISSNETISVRNLVKQISNILGTEVPVLFGGKPYREGEIMTPWNGNCLPQWQPKIDLVTGLHEFLR
jgi:nucleoside-diphosphate-sugar epimerase